MQENVVSKEMESMIKTFINKYSYMIIVVKYLKLGLEGKSMLLIGNGKVITRDNTRPIIDNGCIAVDGNKIVEIGVTEELKGKYTDARFIDAKGKLLCQGLSILICIITVLLLEEWLMIVLQQRNFLIY